MRWKGGPAWPGGINTADWVLLRSSEYKERDKESK